MKSRMIKPGFFEDEKVARLSPMARLLFIGCWLVADDDGNTRAAPGTLRQLFPHDDLSLKGIQKLWDELVQEGLVVPYIANGESFASIPNFSKHQWIKKESAWRNPTPPEGTPKGDLQGTPGDHPLEQEKRREEKRREGGVSPETVLSLWREILVPAGCPNPKRLGKTRKDKIRSRVLDGLDTPEKWREYFTAIRSIGWMVGQGDRGWYADLDYAIRSENVVSKALERADAKQKRDKRGFYEL